MRELAGLNGDNDAEQLGVFFGGQPLPVGKKSANPKKDGLICMLKFNAFQCEANQMSCVPAAELQFLLSRIWAL